MYVGETEPVTRVREDFNDSSELCRVDVPLAVAFGCEIDKINDA